MISEGSCDTENWSNDCWIFSFALTEINLIKKTTFSVFWLNKFTIGEHMQETCFKNIKKILLTRIFIYIYIIYIYVIYFSEDKAV